MTGGLILDAVVGKGAVILELPSGQHEMQLFGRNTLFVVDLDLYVLNGVVGLDLKGHGAAALWLQTLQRGV